MYNSPATLNLLLDMLLLSIIPVQCIRHDSFKSSGLHCRIAIVGTGHRAIDEGVTAKIAGSRVPFGRN